MANSNTVRVTGMFGNGKTYFADAPVIIEISDLFWGDNPTSPFTIVHVEVINTYNGAQEKVGDFRADVNKQTSITFDISSALRAMWGSFDFSHEVQSANNAAASDSDEGFTAIPPEGSEIEAYDDYDEFGVRSLRAYSLKISTEYIDSTDGEFVTTQCVDKDGRTLIPGGYCLMGGMTEWERSIIEVKEDADVSHLEHSNLRNGDASTKPTTSPERVGIDSITSWVDVKRGGTQTYFYSSRAAGGSGEGDSKEAHAPIVLRDSQQYVDFLFVNRRGALETCSALTKESMDITADVKQYSRVEQPTFRPSRSLMAIGSDGRRSWQMSSGYVTREWAEWWTTEFLGGKRKQWWMRYHGKFTPITVTSAKKSVVIYDKSKQTMPSVEFTVTLSLEG